MTDVSNNAEPKTYTDRIGEYLRPHTDEFFFDELSDAYLARTGMADVLTGVPVPIRKTELTGLTNVKIARSMATIIGCDLNFKYRDNYVAFINRSFGKDFARALVADGVDGAAKSDFDYACICFRAALLLDPENVDALYCYGRACKDSYEIGEGEEYVGRYKAESLEAFEKLTLAAPEFDMGFYFLGYAYLNLGLYLKAGLTWDEFLRITAEDEGAEGDEKQKMREEVLEWKEKLEEPIKIEAAYNKILSGKFQAGIDELLPYTTDERFNTWWPMWFYLGTAYESIGDAEEAEKAFLEVLRYSPSNIDAMKELVDIYTSLGNEERAAKYRTKIEIVNRNAEEFRAEKDKSWQ